MQTQDDITQIVKTINLHLASIGSKATARKLEYGETVYVDIDGSNVCFIQPYYKGWGHRREMRAWRLTGYKVPSRTHDQRNRYIERKNLIELINICAPYLRLDTPHEQRIAATKRASGRFNEWVRQPDISPELFLAAIDEDREALPSVFETINASRLYVLTQAANSAAHEMWHDFDNRMQQKEAA